MHHSHNTHKLISLIPLVWFLFLLHSVTIAQPSHGSAHSARDGKIRPSPVLDDLDFRCILVGDSQTTNAYWARMRTQMHRWDADTIGDLVCYGGGITGYLVNNYDWLLGVKYENIDPNQGWPNGGPSDFFAIYGANWTFAGDIDAASTPIGRYRLDFGLFNDLAPWPVAWGVNERLVARIAVRTSPNSIGAIETRPERGGVISQNEGRVHLLSKEWGVQVFEQPISTDFGAFGRQVGVGLYLPKGAVEHRGEMLQVLGVTIEREFVPGVRSPGLFVAYQGRAGWNASDQNARVSQPSRKALIEMTDADHVMIMLGHNEEDDGVEGFATQMRLLVRNWEHAYNELGRERPQFIFVVPWVIESIVPSGYLYGVRSQMIQLANQHPSDRVISFMDLHDFTRPDVLDPERYILDANRVHPADVPTAIHLADDFRRLLIGVTND